jgi:hypothetical protein
MFDPTPLFFSFFQSPGGKESWLSHPILGGICDSKLKIEAKSVENRLGVIVFEERRI